MKIYTSDKIIAWLTLLSGLSISAVAVWYSVAGLVSIFAAAAVPIMIMGVALEVSKLVATIWLKINWSIAPRLIKTYLIIAIAILMMITSMGIFGFLSKAHLDQAVPTGDVADKVALIDEKIKTQKENIDAARKALKQMDESVDQTMARSSDEKGADKAAALRRGQQRERTALQNDIGKAQKEIGLLNEQRAPFAKELRKVEAEVGPIKYIAALLYGDNPDQNLLESAVRWVIIIIVVVFDPLAVILLLASQYSFQWFRKEEQDQEPQNYEMSSDIHELETLKSEPEPEAAPTPEKFYPQPSLLWPFPAQWNSPVKEEVTEDIKVEPTVVEPEEPSNEVDDEEIINDAHAEEKAAMRKWKEENPDNSLKKQRKLFEQGLITELPWDEYLKAKANFTDDDAAQEAAKWALEQIEKKSTDHGHYIGLDQRPGDYLPPSEEPKKKDSDMDGTTGQGSDQEGQGRLKGYQQNAEQNERTIWQRIQDAKK